MSYLDQNFSMDLLGRAWQKISQKSHCPGIDGIDLSLYQSDLVKNLRALQTSIVCGMYRPYAGKAYVRKGRTICLHCLDDKIVQTAIAELINAKYHPPKCVYGFIKNCSVFTAKHSLDYALNHGVCDFSKIDIKSFYGSISKEILLKQISSIFDDEKMFDLMQNILASHCPGISTGSCLSPALSNLYLEGFDRTMEKESVFYARYVDDILVSPIKNIDLAAELLFDLHLDINPGKSKYVNASEGFRYLGFDIKRDIDAALQKGDFALAESIYEPQPRDVTEATQPGPDIKSPVETKIENNVPNTIRNVIRKCHIVKSIVEKAENERCLDFPEKQHLLQIFHCLGEDGRKFIHQVISICDDYDFAETERRIKRYCVNNPIGCKKLCERVGDNSKCTCNFSNEKTYPTPIIHALRVDRGCFKFTDPKENIGHFKAKTPQHKAMDALTSLISLNEKQYEISEQQAVLKGQIENLFERTGTREIMTPQGLLLKTDEGFFIKVG